MCICCASEVGSQNSFCSRYLPSYKQKVVISSSMVYLTSERNELILLEEYFV